MGIDVMEAERRLRRARIAFARGDAVRCRAALAEGLAMANGSRASVEAGLLVLSAQLTAWDFDPARSLAAARRAAAAARRSGAFVAAAELVLAQALFVLGSDACVGRYRAARRAAAAAGDFDVVFETWSSEIAALQAFGRADEAILAADSLRSVARERHKHAWAQQAAWSAARIRWLAYGEVGPAVEAFQGMLHLRALGLRRPQLLGDLAVALADGGEADEARRMIARAAAEAGTRWTAGVTAFYRAEIEWAVGRPAKSLEAAEVALRSGLPQPLELVVRGIRLWARFDLGRRVHDPELVGSPPPLFAGVLDENAAFRALDAGTLEEAELALVAAAGRWQRNVARCELRAAWGAGELARRRGDVVLALERLNDVEQRAVELGLVSVLARARTSLRKLPGSRLRSTVRDSTLSNREAEVLGLVGAGASSKEIARKLGASPRTVDAHVAAAMAKLGAATRLQAASIARASLEGGWAQPDVPPDVVALLRMLAEGSTVSRAAERLGLSRRTATRRLASARAELGVRTNAEAVQQLSLPAG